MKRRMAAEPSIDEGGDWDGADDPETVAAAGAQDNALRDRGSLLEELESRGEVPALDHPLVRVAPFAVGGAILVAGAKLGYMRQMHE